jgi:hypothetical protein
MLKAPTALKVFWPNLILFTCLAHGLQCVALKVRAKFPQGNKLMLIAKHMFLKAPRWLQTYKQDLP